MAGVTAFISCKKEYSCEGCTIQTGGVNPTQQNQPPVARAGTDQTISLPTNTANLDGSGSTDPDSNIINYEWRTISGPSGFNIVNPTFAQTQITGIIEGSYVFELKVTDAGGLTAKDTVNVSVVPTVPSQQGGNVFFFFPDPTGSIPHTWLMPTNPRVKLVIVKIANYPEGYIEGVWCSNCAPRCPISSDYNIEPGNYTSFNLPPGTYSWTAESVATDLNSYPNIPANFHYFMATPHSTGGTITIQPNANCIIEGIYF